MKKITFLLFVILTIGCKQKNNLPTVAFIDHFEDATINKAKQGFFDALDKAGFSEDKKTINVIYRNAQGSDISLNQIIQYCKAQQPTLIATCPTTPTIATIQQVQNIPVFMLVAPKPSLMQLKKTPQNLFGVGDDIDYIDTSLTMIPKLLPNKKHLKIGMIYNQGETQSVDALNRIKALAAQKNIDIVALPVNNSADADLVTSTILSKNIDAFFANPDNVVFASFEVILKKCNQANVPIFTSESGLVARGAAAAYGADMYAWGYQTGLQAAQYLQTKSTLNLHWEMVQKHSKVYNEATAKKYHILVDSSFKKI